MSKLFKRKELERLQCVTDDDVALVLKYQKKLPILCDNDSLETFCVDARELYKQLGVKKKFSPWIKANTKGYIENVDFTTSSPRDTDISSGKFVNELEYNLTLDLAKEISMFTGRNTQASAELKENSHLARKYFILMEKIVQENKEWLTIRDPEKEEYKRMSTEIDAWMFRIWHKKATRADYAVEADGINKIVTGKTSKELKAELGVGTYDLVRDYLKKDHNEELLFLEKQNQVLLRMNMGYTKRMNMLTKMHEVTFKDKKIQRAA